MTEPLLLDDFDFPLWLAELQGALHTAGEGYLNRDPDDDGAEFIEDHWPPIPSNRTSFAWLTVMAVMNAIGKLPQMHDHVGLVPLHDLVAALIDLGQGGKPKLLQPLPSVGKGKELTQRRWVKQHALLFVEILVGSGMKATDACKSVASTMSASGHGGRKRESGGKLSWKTVEGWRNAQRQRDFASEDPRMAEFIKRSVERVAAEHGWPLSAENAKALIQAMATDKLLASKA